MKIAIAQTNPVIGDFDFNKKKMLELVNQAATQRCDLVVFPELAISGYPPGDLLEKDDFIDRQLACLDEFIAAAGNIGILCGAVQRKIENGERLLFNSAMLFENRKPISRTDKQLLPTYDIFDESRYFTPGSASTLVAYRGLKLGITICEDIWNDEKRFSQKHYDRNPVADLAHLGADLLINLAASPFHGGKQDLRNTMLTTMAAKYNLPMVFANQVGGNDTTIFDGLSCAVTAKGEFAALASDFSEDLICFDTDTGIGDQHPVSTSENEAILKALVTGTRDYVTKCGFKKVLIGSSGGIDSALTAAIAVKALGSKNVKTIFMPSIYTSQQNFIDTKQLADNLGTSWQSIPIAPMYDAFLTLSETFDPTNPGIAEQNIQARIRGTILMAFSNKEGCMLLSTGNKSEMAVGYSTLYGDMCGGLAVIGDLPKKKVYDLSRLINSDRELIPVSIIDKAPSAELAPGQTDQDDLPSYDFIDAVVKAHVEEHKSIDEMVAQGLDRDAVVDIVSRINRNEYKRYQAPPILRVTSKAFGAGRRHPMAQRYKP